MWPNLKYLVTFTEEILNGKLHSLCKCQAESWSLQTYINSGNNYVVFLGKFLKISEQLLEHTLIQLPGTAVNQYSIKLTSSNTVISTSLCRNLVETHRLRKVSAIHRNCVFIKFRHQEIMWNFGILHSDYLFWKIFNYYQKKISVGFPFY